MAITHHDSGTVQLPNGKLATGMVPLDASGSIVGDTTAACADEARTGSSTAVGPTEATYAPADEVAATCAFVTVADNPIRYRTSGDDPTASVGHEVASGGYFEVFGAENVANLRMIRSDTSDAEVFISYERPVA